MKSFCPECGAPISAGDSCTERFHRFMALEMTDEGYGAVHHLTVAAYMLQHPSRLSRRGWIEMRTLLDKMLIAGISPQELRIKLRLEVDSGRRSWSLVKGPRMQLPDEFRWTLTILSMEDGDTAQYRADIERWARTVLADAEKIAAG